MYAERATLSNYVSTDAEFRAWATAVHDMLVEAGLTQTADTGQINLATVLRPAANASAGYEIFRFNDAEQATLPIFLKVFYGMGNPANLPGINIHVGTGTNGSGTLTGQTTGLGATINGPSNTAPVSGQTRPAWAAYADGALSVAFGLDEAAGRGSFFLIERPKLADGTRTTDGYLYFARGYGSGSSVAHSHAVRAAGGGPAASTSTHMLGAPYQLDGQDDIVGADVALYPTPVILNGNLRWSSLLRYRASAFGGNAVVSVNMFGAAKNYRTIGSYTEGASSQVHQMLPAA